MKKFRWFSFDDFTCHCGCKENKQHEDFIDKCDDLRDACGFPLKPSSGYRCPKHNKEVSTTGEFGPHTTGRSVDFLVSRHRAHIVVREAMKLGFTGIGVSQKGDMTKRFIHLDDLPDAPGQPRPTLWSY